ncbi:GNAT family N-acetyltransferase [Thorsellia anophelis]|uniref:Ribosomal protein S18 acetylase RimI n=1 Tax=Thorsellia anophelis DSM 18579 TaxID=1123402 RepID=A0A1I0ELE7_9GAMM|nr:GNAT family N-acetyltransferase [Thorsellia anophelis]SET46201.1 Ribosomal protein S18 acetylase RimI [Thorsellia anophelis DSM 18579]
MSDRFESMEITDKRLSPILEGLFKEYKTIYGGYFSWVIEEDKNEDYRLPNGAVWVLWRNNNIIAMGAFKPFSDKTAEFKRIWTEPSLRQQGLASKMLEQLELSAYLLGYQNVYLSTGFKQIAAVKLYLKQGYCPQFELSEQYEHLSHPPYDGRLRFTKSLFIEKQHLIASIA